MHLSLDLLLALAIPVVVLGPIFFLLDLWAHEGVTIFTRRRVLRSGMAAPARIVSDKMLDRSVIRFGASRSAYSIVYEVLPPGAPPFRAKGVEVMTMLEDDANLRASRRGALQGEDVKVEVKFDPRSQVVVLVRVDTKAWQQARDVRSEAAKAELRRLGKGD